MMAPFLKIIFLALCGLATVACGGTNIDVFKQFGEEPFDRQKWLSGDETAKGKMVYDFLKQHAPIQQLGCARNDLKKAPSLRGALLSAAAISRTLHRV